MAFAVISAARLPLLPPSRAGPLTTLQTSRDAADRPVAPPCRAFDTGLRPGPFPDRAASLLPGLLAATRTGLPPASDDELTTTDQPPTRSTSCLLGARENLNDAAPLPTKLVRHGAITTEGLARIFRDLADCQGCRGADPAGA